MAEKLLRGRTALVTGASSGLGWRIAVCLAEAGANVAITARREDRLSALATELTSHDVGVLPLALDVRDRDNIEEVMARAEQALAPIDILVNNAGVSVAKRPEDCDRDDYDFIMETNLDGPWFCSQTVGKRMIARGEGGKIINIASLIGLRPLGKLALYGATKAALIHLTKALALEWARHDIQINAVCPGYIETEMNAPLWQSESGKAFMARFPRGRVGRPEDLDGAIRLFASGQSNFITGAVLSVDDGQQFM